MIWNKTTFERGIKTADEWTAEQRALALLDEYTLVSSGLVSLQDLGYRTVDGCVPAWKVRQMLDVLHLIEDARQRKPPD